MEWPGGQRINGDGAGGWLFENSNGRKVAVIGGDGNLSILDLVLTSGSITSWHDLNLLPNTRRVKVDGLVDMDELYVNTHAQIAEGLVVKCPVGISSLKGNGSAFACISGNGTIYRSLAPCR